MIVEGKTSQIKEEAPAVPEDTCSNSRVSDTKTEE